jgi:hypothetical protein
MPVMTERIAARKPFHVRCGACGHVWPVLFTPLPIEKAAAILQSCRCPMCGNGPDNVFAFQQTPAPQEDARERDPADSSRSP